MARAPRKTLGLALHDGMILAAEIRSSGARRLASRAAAFSFPEGVDLGDPAALGKAFAEFLKSEQFSARQALIGLPAQWLMTKRLSVPATEEATLASVLRIQAERAFSHSGRDLAIDYIAQGGEGAKQNVLLFAAMQEKVEQTRAFARAAGLTVLGITSSATTLALAGAGAGASQATVNLVVQLIPGSIELAIHKGDRFRLIRHLPVSVSAGAWVDSLTSELRRVIASTTLEDGAIDDGQLVLWDGVGLPPDARDRIGQRLSLATRDDLSLLALAEVNGIAPSGPEAVRFAASVALARAAVDPELRAIDFASSRLAPPRKARFDWRLRVAAISAVAVLLALGVMVADWHTRSRAVDTALEQLQGQTPTVRAAESLIAKVETAAGWYDARPRSLECLLQLSRAFPDDGRIWTTELSLPADRSGVLSGKAVDDRAVLEVFEEMRSSTAFSEVKLHGIRYPQDRSRDRNVSFSISFRFEHEK